MLLLFFDLSERSMHEETVILQGNPPDAEALPEGISEIPRLDAADAPPPIACRLFRDGIRINESLNDPNLAEAERYSGEAAGRLQASTWQSRLSPVIVPLAAASVSWSLYVIMTTPDPMLADKERSRIFRVLAAVALFYLIPSLIRTVSGM